MENEGKLRQDNTKLYLEIILLGIVAMLAGPVQFK